jgi:DedD protein
MTSDVRAALDAGDDGFHEIQLNGKQLVFLGMATTLVSVVIFLCGVLVGRGVKPLDTVAQAAGPQAFEMPATPSVPPGASAAPDPAPAPAPTSSGSGSAAAGAAVIDGGAGDTEPTPLGDEAEAPSATDVGVAPPVAAPRAATRTLAEAQPTTAPKVERKEPVTPKPAPAQATAVPPAVSKPVPTAAASKTASPPVATTPEPAPTAVTTTAPATGGGRIAVQVGAFKTRSEADALARRLSGRGYAVYVMPPTSDGKNVYRVRVGNYGTADEAQRVSARLTSQERLKPWIIR